MYVCKVCGENFETGIQRSNHESKHQKVDCLCPHCGKSFDKKHKLNDHINNNHKFENCPTCNKK